MSMYLEFEPHSWYMGFAIKDGRADHKTDEMYSEKYGKGRSAWEAYTENGNFARVDDLEANTLADLKAEIRSYHLKRGNGLVEY